MSKETIQDLGPQTDLGSVHRESSRQLQVPSDSTVKTGIQNRMETCDSIKYSKSTVTTPQYMGGTVSYTTTMTVLTHSLHDHVDRSMKSEDVACHIMKNDQSRSMRECLCTSKAELTLETVVRSWDDTLGNIWHRLSACDQHSIPNRGKMETLTP